MLKVPYGQDPYSVIGKYIRDHITVIEDIIAVIKIDEVETNQLFTVDINEENYFIWENDWWEGEKNITLIDFFPVSEAQRANQSVQSTDTISRQAAIDNLKRHLNGTDVPDHYPGIFSAIEEWLSDWEVPSAQPESHWIPVRKSLPENESSIIITTKDGRLYFATYEVNRDFPWQTTNDAWRLNDVIAWMPRPEPFKENEK